MEVLADLIVDLSYIIPLDVAVVYIHSSPFHYPSFSCHVLSLSAESGDTSGSPWS